MRRLFIFATMALIVVACKDKSKEKNGVFIAEENVVDTTVYGICGEGTMMHTLQLVTNDNDTIDLLIDDDSNLPTRLVGGLMSGDRMAVTMQKSDGRYVADRIINISSLLGKWSSLDKNFELTDDGEVHSYVAAETSTWTMWRILNGQLLLNRDTFDIVTLGADSLELENRQGIFLFKRSRAVASENDGITDTEP